MNKTCRMNWWCLECSSVKVASHFRNRNDCNVYASQSISKAHMGAWARLVGWPGGGARVGATTAVFTVRSYRFQRCFFSRTDGEKGARRSVPVLIIPSGENSVSKNNLCSSDWVSSVAHAVLCLIALPCSKVHLLVVCSFVCVPIHIT